MRRATFLSHRSSHRFFTMLDEDLWDRNVALLIKGVGSFKVCGSFLWFLALVWFFGSSTWKFLDVRTLHPVLSLVQKRAALSVNSADWGGITLSPKMNRTRVRLEAYRDHLFNQISVCLFGPLLVRTWVRLLHSHLHKGTVSNGGNTLKFDSTDRNKAGVKELQEMGFRFFTLYVCWLAQHICDQTILYRFLSQTNCVKQLLCCFITFLIQHRIGVAVLSDINKQDFCCLTCSERYGFKQNKQKSFTFIYVAFSSIIHQTREQICLRCISDLTTQLWGKRSTKKWQTVCSAFPVHVRMHT